MTITSHIEGRLRVRDPRLRKIQVLDSLREKLLLHPNVREVSCNLKTGSLLILYRKVRDAFEGISNLLAESLGQATLRNPTQALRKSPAKRCRPVLSKRRLVNFGMLVALLVSLAALAGSKQLHIIAGVIFLGIVAMHILDKRASLFA